MRGRIIIGAAIAALALGAPSAALAAPGAAVTIQGTPGNDLISIVADSPVSGTYTVNGQSTSFVGARKIKVEAGDGSDRIEITNPTGSLLAPVDGIRVDAGAGSNSFSETGGQALDGTYRREAGGPGTAEVTHTGAPSQRVALVGVVWVSDLVASDTFRYRGTPGADSVTVVGQPHTGPGRGPGSSYLQDSDTTLITGSKTEIIDTGRSGSTPDTVTLTGDQAIAAKLVVDDGTATPDDTVTLSNYQPNVGGRDWGVVEDLAIRAGHVVSTGSLVAKSLAVEAAHIDPIFMYVDRVEAESAGDIQFSTSGGIFQVGGVSDSLHGVKSSGGNVSLTGGSVGVDTGEQIAGANIDLESSALAINGNVSAPGGTVSLVPRPSYLGAAHVDLGTTSDTNYGVSDAEFDRIDAAQVNVGAADSDLVTVSAPITLSHSTGLAVESGNGFTATSGALPINVGSLDAGDLTLVDGSSTGRAWSVTPSGVQVGGGAPIPFGTPDALSVKAGAGDDSFAVKASPQVAYSLDGGAGSDSLTYDAEGRSTGGDADPPDGSITSWGVRAVAFGSIEAVSITP
jgi:hypothetical protein